MSRIDVKDACKEIRAKIKKEMGLNSRQVSVRAERMSTADAIHVLIKVPAKWSDITRIVYAYESIRLDADGNVQRGGNRYIHIAFAPELLASISEPVLDTFKAALANPDKAYRLGKFFSIRKSDTDHVDGIYITHMGDERPMLACGAHHAAEKFAERSLGQY
jgi:hypothetical protein